MKLFTLLHTKMKLHPLHLKMLPDVNQMWEWFYDARSCYGACLSNKHADCMGLGFRLKP